MVLPSIVLVFGLKLKSIKKIYGHNNLKIKLLSCVISQNTKLSYHIKFNSSSLLSNYYKINIILIMFRYFYIDKWFTFVKKPLVTDHLLYIMFQTKNNYYKYRTIFKAENIVYEYFYFASLKYFCLINYLWNKYIYV